MNKTELLEFLTTDPDKAFTVLEKHGFENLPVDELPKDMTQDMFGLKEKQIKTVEFIFWISYLLERKTGEIIAQGEKNKAEVSVIDLLLDELPFGSKVKVVKQLYLLDEKYKPLKKILEKVVNLRNLVGHGKFNKLEYGGYNLEDPRGKWKLAFEIRNATNIKD